MTASQLGYGLRTKRTAIQINIKLFSVITVGGSVGIVILRMACVLWDIKQMNSYIAAGK